MRYRSRPVWYRRLVAWLRPDRRPQMTPEWQRDWDHRISEHAWWGPDADAPGRAITGRLTPDTRWHDAGLAD